VTDFVERLYASAANAGLLKECLWQPAQGAPFESRLVGFSAPDDTLLDGLTSSTEYVITYPASVFVGLAARDSVLIAGATFQVREVRAVGDGSEIRVKLTRL
jgi:hypothetical protein